MINLIPISGILNKHNPYIGYFYYSPPSLSSSSSLSCSFNSFLVNSLIPLNEIKRRYKIKIHPFSGYFHFSPGEYSDLYSLNSYIINNNKENNNNNKNNKNDKNNKKEEEEQDNNNTNNFNKANSNSINNNIKNNKIDNYFKKNKKRKRSYSYSNCEKYIENNSILSLIQKNKYYNDDIILDYKKKQIYHHHFDIHFHKKHQQSQQHEQYEFGRIFSWKIKPRPFTTTSLDSSENKMRQKSCLVLKEWSSSKSLLNQPNDKNNSNNNKSNCYCDINIVPLPPTTPIWHIHHIDGINEMNYHFKNNNYNNDISNNNINNNQFMTDKYIIYPSHLLGEGSYARIYLGRQKYTLNYVAIKVLNINVSYTSFKELSEFDSLSNEIENHSKFLHPHILTIYDVYQSTNFLYIIMEYCSGGTLEQMLQLRNKFDEEETKIIIYQLLSGLAEIHRNGIIHDDIRPANILFQPSTKHSSNLNNHSNLKHSQQIIHSHTSNKLQNHENLMNPINLLYEKRKKQGKLTITLNQRNKIESVIDEMRKNEIEQTLLQDTKNAIICETYHNHNYNHSQQDKNNYNEEDSNLLSLSNQQQQQQICYKSPHGLILKVCDFGLSKKIPYLTKHKTKQQQQQKLKNKVKLNYSQINEFISPEKYLTGNSHLKSDIWNVGIITYKCLCGNNSINSNFIQNYNVEKLLSNKILQKFNKKCINFIQSLFEIDINKRVTAETALHDPWFDDMRMIWNILIPSQKISELLKKQIENNHKLKK